VHSKRILTIQEGNIEVFGNIVEGRDFIRPEACCECFGPWLYPRVIVIAVDYLLHGASAHSLHERPFDLPYVDRWVDT